ncbi:hypothetical protein ACR6C2_35285 [Streptomyces sp. INA 01156]
MEGLLGTHPRITDRRLILRLDEFLARTQEFREHETPAFRAFQRRRTALVDAERTRLRLDDHRPRVMSTFVRNRLVDEVYLPLIGTASPNSSAPPASPHAPAPADCCSSSPRPATARPPSWSTSPTGSASSW